MRFFIFIFLLGLRSPGVRRFAREKVLERSGVAERKRRHGDEQRSRFYVLLRSRGYLVASAILGTQAKVCINGALSIVFFFSAKLK